MTPPAPAAGFTDPTPDAQQTFRGLLDALANPGTRHRIVGPESAPAQLGPAMTGVLLTLLDEHSPLHLVGGLANSEVVDHLTFHTGARMVPLDQAAFAVARADELPSLRRLRTGTDEAPHDSATLLIDARGTGGRDTLLQASGPGIRDRITVDATWAPTDFLAQWQSLAEDFPRGIDVFIVGEADVVGLPRTTRLTAEPTSRTEN